MNENDLHVIPVNSFREHDANIDCWCSPRVDDGVPHSTGARVWIHSASWRMELRGNAAVEIFPFVTGIHLEVVLRHHDGESQDIEMTPDEAELIAGWLLKTAKAARERGTDPEGRDF